MKTHTFHSTEEIRLSETCALFVIIIMTFHLLLTNGISICCLIEAIICLDLIFPDHNSIQMNWGKFCLHEFCYCNCQLHFISFHFIGMLINLDNIFDWTKDKDTITICSKHNWLLFSIFQMLITNSNFMLNNSINYFEKLTFFLSQRLILSHLNS